MANSDKNLVITPATGSSTDDPKIVFSGANSSLAGQNITIRAYPENNGTLSFEGSAGQLFSITNSLTGTLFSVNDISGVPSLEIEDTGTVTLARFPGNVLVGSGTSISTDKLQVTGNIAVTTAGSAKFFNTANTFFTALKANASAAANVTYTLPSTDGSNGQVLSTNGSGTLSWANGGVGYTGSAGATGSIGYTGSIGPQGPGGGYTGSIGFTGSVGAAGITVGAGVTYYAGTNNSYVYSVVGSLETINSMTITIPASTSSRTFEVGSTIAFSGHQMRFAVMYDGAMYLPSSSTGMSGLNAADGHYSFTVSGVIITVPGDNATHTISLGFEASGSTSSITVYGRWIKASEISNNISSYLGYTGSVGLMGYTGYTGSAGAVSSNITSGYTTTAYDAGTKSSGTFTPDATNGNIQKAVNGGAHTLAAPSVGTGDSVNMVIQYTNSGSAGTITTSGFTKVDGSFDTTNGNVFFCYITVVGANKYLNITAMQ